MMKLFFLLLLCSSIFHTSSATELSLVFRPQYSKQPLILSEEKSFFYAPDSLEIETFRWYISGIVLKHNGKAIWSEANSFHLLDAGVPGSLRLALDVPVGTAYDALCFQLGIDSLTNVSGALEGDLDPVKGMYWAWQSGYINLKLEGKSARIKKKEFQFHLGGYLFPYNALQELTLPAGTGAAIQIGVDTKRFLDSIDLAAQSHIMSPGKAAVQLSRLAAGMFFIIP